MSTQSPALFYNSRFYILCTTMLGSIALFAWLRLGIDDDHLLAIRAQQLYGLLALCFWYIAMIISPLRTITGKQHLRTLTFSRRAIGVSAFYFAGLHGVIALWGQLGGVSQLPLLPSLFHWSLACGLFAFAILTILAATSFNRVVTYMTFRRWKWLHRSVYLAGVAVIAHVWSIGTHIAYPAVQWAAFSALMLLLGLELWRIIKTSRAQRYLSIFETALTFITAWALVGVIVGSLPVLVQNYHSRHTTTSPSGTTEQGHRH